MIRSKISMLFIVLAFTACGESEKQPSPTPQSPNDNGATSPADPTSGGTLPGGTGTIPSDTTPGDTLPPITTATPQDDKIFQESFKLVLSTNEEANICFTLDSAVPTEKSNQYNKPIPINQTTVVQFFAMDKAGNREAVQKKKFRIDMNRKMLTLFGAQ